MKKTRYNYRKILQKISIFSFIVLLVAAPFVINSLLHKTSVNAEWWSDAWGYRQGIRFTNGGSDVTDQKVLVQFATNTPISANKLQSSCQDIRFTDAQGKLLKYYINVSGGAGVGCNDASSDFYVLLPSIPAGVNLIYIYYGNPGAPAGTVSANFGNATFSPSAGPTAASEEVSPGPVAYWKFDENQGSTAGDSTGHGNSLTLTSTAWATQSASLSNRTTYLTFNGSTSVASRANDTDFDFGTGSFSVSSWFRHASMASFTDVLITKYNTQGWKVYMNASGFVCFGIDDDSTWGPDDSACSTTSFADSKWHHVEVVKSTTTSITLYVDGNQVAQTTSLTATSTLSTTATLYVGADSAGNTSWWDGSLDDIALYPYARSAAEVKSDASGIHATTVMGAQADDPLTNGLVGYWKMDDIGIDAEGESITDSSGNGTSGALFGDNGVGDNGTGMNCTDNGKFGTGCSFDGTDDYIITSSSVLALSNAVSLSAWIKPDTTSGVRTIISNNNAWDYRMYQYNTDLYVQVSLDDGNSGYHLVSGVLSANTWQHVVSTFDGTTVKIYLNGTLLLREAAVGSIQTPATGITIGAGGGGGYELFSGNIDEARVYNRVLSDREVRQLYNWAPGPIGWWKMDEQTGSTANDSSGNWPVKTWSGTGASHWSTGKYGSAGQFNGVDDNLVVGDISSKLNLDTASPPSFTFEMWAKPEAGIEEGGGSAIIDHDARLIFRNAICSSSPCFGFQLVAGSTISNSAPVQYGVWYHVAGQYNKEENLIKIYLNGVLQDSDTPATVDLSAHSGTTMTIGHNQYDFKGGIDDVRVYNYARTTAQIIEDMNGGHPPAGSPVGSAILHLKFDEAYGATANNSGFLGSTGNGAITGATWYPGGTVGGAIATTTSTNFINSGDQTFVDSATGLTTGFWVKPITLATNKALISKSNFSNQNSFAVVTDNTNSDEVRVHIPTSVSDVGTYFLTSNLNLAADTWSYMSVIYNASESASTRVRVYKDGKEISGSVTGTLPDKLTTGTTSLIKVGASDSGSYTALNAVFDEVKVYSYPLTYEQMLIDYNGKNSMVLGSLSTHSDGVTASSSASRAFCVPGDTSTCNPPIGYWPMDENNRGTYVYDKSGNNRNFLISDNSYSAESGKWKSGKIGSALDYNGADDFSYTADNAAFTPNTFTYSLWVKLDRLPSQTGKSGTLVYKEHGVSPWYSYIMYVNTDDTVYFAWYNTTPTQFIQKSSIALTANSWNHLTFIKDSSSMKIYINGIDTSALSPTPTGSTLDSTSVLMLNFPGGTQDFDGQLDDIRLYNYVRTPAQIAWDYNRGAPLVWYKFDECQGATAYNLSPNADGKAAGMNGVITIGATGTNTSAGTCGSGTSTEAWNNGSSGKYGASLVFDGTDDVVNIYSAALNSSFNTSYGSVSLWLKMDPSAWAESGTTRSALQIAADTSNYIRIIKTSTANTLSLNYNGGGTIKGSDYVATDTTNWVHVVMTWDSTEGKVKSYINGALLGTASGMGTWTGAIAATRANIGARLSTAVDPFDGQIDDVRIYTYPLTLQQVQVLKNEGSAVRFGP